MQSNVLIIIPYNIIFKSISENNYSVHIYSNDSKLMYSKKLLIETYKIYQYQLMNQIYLLQL